MNPKKREEVRKKLNNNISKNLLDVEFWNYKLIIDNYLKDTNKDFEQSFLNLFLLTKNNKKKQYELQKYFMSNYNYFNEKNIQTILKNFN